ncbi:MAG: ribonuclease E/G [Ilumatobacteraceae bacterium]
MPLLERHHVHEQLHKVPDRKVWLPSGGSLIIEHTEALTVIDVNTGKNVGTTNPEETVFRNKSSEAAEEVAAVPRLRDIGGIVVIDFIDMEIRTTARRWFEAFRSAPPATRRGPGVRHQRARSGRDDAQADRRGVAHQLRRPVLNCEGRGVVVDHVLLG